MKKRSFKFTHFFLICLLTVLLLPRCSIKEPYIKYISEGYKGVVIRITQPKAKYFTIKTQLGKIIEVGALREPLSSLIEVGDTIEKYTNENYCALHKNGLITKYCYIYIPKSVRNNSKFPEEWKNKWLECGERVK